MKRTLPAIAVALALAPATLLHAHPGPRIWLGLEDGKIITYLSDDNINPTVYLPESVFIGGGEEDTGPPTGLFSDLGGGIHTTAFPGFEQRHSGGVPTGGIPTTAVFTFSIAGPLHVYDAGTTSFRTVADVFGGSAPQIAVSFNSVFVTASGEVNGEAFFQADSPGAHSHLDFTFFGDGTTASDGPIGVYALPLQLSATGGPADSDVFWILLGKGVALNSATYQDAIAASALLPVPEPAAAVLVLPVLAGGAWMLRRRRGR